MAAALLSSLPWRACILGILSSTIATVDAYSFSDINRRDISGVWRLRSQRAHLPKLEDLASRQQKHLQARPMKEFTTYPKKKPTRPALPPIEEEEMLLMLRDDGKFIQYGGITPTNDDDDQHDNEAGEDLLLAREFAQETERRDKNAAAGIMKGTWDYIDGKLILAADRPKNAGESSGGESSAGAAKGGTQQHDTILVGQVVAKSEESLADNPALVQSSNNATNLASDTSRMEGGNATSSEASRQEEQSLGEAEESQRSSSSFDVHLSVPQGTVEIGKFMYPKHHPEFFEQPMFKPVSSGSFTLRQILGTLNTKSKEEEEEIEMYTREGFYGKRFFLTSHPLEPHQPKGRTRWSLKHNKFVQDGPREKTDEEKKEEEKRPINIRVMELEFYANNTFSTVGGLGSTILRGKWSIIGEKKDQLWMQVMRFGFGRSVSGSVYSEGMGLTHNDAKAYWGRIKEVDGDGSGDGEGKEDAPEGDTHDNKQKNLEVKGSVLDGWGLEPEPVARFTMIEKTEESWEDDDEDDDDGDPDEDVDAIDSLHVPEDDYDPFDSPDAFQ